MSVRYSSAISLSRYGNVPLCNFDEDFGVFLSDVLYFRSLKQQNHITWYSESGLPDLGGNEFEELRIASLIAYYILLHSFLI